MNTYRGLPGRRCVVGVSFLLCVAAVMGMQTAVALPPPGASEGVPATAPAPAPAKAEAKAKAKTPAYAWAIRLLSAGKQAAAEGVIRESLDGAADRKGKLDTEEVFLLAVMTRSRFEIEEAAPLLDYVNQTAPKSVHGRAAGYIRQLDTKEPSVEDSFKSLQELAAQKPADPLLIWMVGVQCRSLNRNEIGVAAYAELCKLWNPGPVLVHQTYANMLDELEQYDEALIHRQLAVKLEPAPWSLDGLGLTLTALKRWEEADAAYAKTTQMAPQSARYWRHWASSKSERGDADGAAKMAAKAQQLEKAGGR